MSEPLIQNISDTARWVAYYRAMETERGDAIFKDPLAKRLAGKKGEEIVKKLPYGKSSAWYLIVRTKVLDEIILSLVQNKKIDAVLNLAAGLDARPYRLDLPKDFTWFEADLPGILEYKEKVIGKATPQCRLERFRCDLANITERKDLFRQIGMRTKSCLVITEGLLIYLEKELVDGLSKDLLEIPSFHFWLLDFASEIVMAMVEKRWNKELTEGNSRMKFAPPGGPKYFESLGWKIAEVRWSMREAKRVGREMPFGPMVRFFSRFMSQEKRKGYEQSSGFLLLSR